MTKKQLRVLFAKLELHKKEIAKHRDALRGLLDEVETTEESVSSGLEDIESGIERISETL